MARTVLLEKDGIIREGKVGISWTFFFFSFFVPLFRGDIKWFLISFIFGIVLLPTTLGTGNFVFNIILTLVYNKIYTRNLLESGYKPLNDSEAAILNLYGIAYK